MQKLTCLRSSNRLQLDIYSTLRFCLGFLPIFFKGKLLDFKNTRRKLTAKIFRLKEITLIVVNNKNEPSKPENVYSHNL